ncbi:MAG TPA: FecR domain-containing protein [Rhodanobacter sp.]
MTNPDTAPRDELPVDIVDQAIRWSVRLRFGRARATTHVAFREWLATSPQHALAWERMQSLDSPFQGVPASVAMATLATARGGVDKGRRKTLKLLGWSGTALVGGWLLRDQVPWWRVIADDSTATGVQRRVPLAEGAVVTLNTQSAIDTELTASARIVRLRRGEMHATTGNASAAQRPLRVVTSFGSMESLDTRFVVRLEDDSALISILGGTLRLVAGTDGDSAIAQAGDTWRLTRKDASKTTPLPFDPDGWMDGVIAGRQMRLADLVAELGRYRAGHVSCDAAVADLRVSGVYQIRDTDQALRFLASTQPVRAVYCTRYWVRIMPAQEA